VAGLGAILEVDATVSQIKNDTVINADRLDQLDGCYRHAIGDDATLNVMTKPPRPATGFEQARSSRSVGTSRRLVATNAPMPTASSLWGT
jgi:hypothetical protein